MTAAVHHVRVVLRLLGTTRGGLVAMLALVNCVPMVDMAMFSGRFTRGYDLAAFISSLLFSPLCRWALGSALGVHKHRSTASLLPLTPRARAVAEALAVALALAATVAAVVGIVALIVGWDPALREVLISLIQLGTATVVLALPHLLVASLDREAPHSARMWARWLVPPALLGLGLMLSPAHSFVGHLTVGLLAAAIIVAWGPLPWLATPRRRTTPLTELDARATTRDAPTDPHATLAHDFWRGLGVGSLRGALWAALLVGPPVALLWWRHPALSLAGAIAVAAVVAGAFPLGLRARVVGGRWVDSGDFGRAWSALPIPRRAIARAVHLHTAACSAVALLAPALALVLVGTPSTSEVWTTPGLFAAVGLLSLVGIRTNAAVGTRSLWQLSWFTGSAAMGCLWLSRFTLVAPRFSTVSWVLSALAVVAALAVSLSPVSLLRTRSVATA